MHEDNQTDEMAPAERRRAVAAILAAGVIRYRRTAKLGTSSAGRKSANSGRNPLELARKSRLSVTTGSGG